jgi:hypothetical protein
MKIIIWIRDRVKKPFGLKLRVLSKDLEPIDLTSLTKQASLP